MQDQINSIEDKQNEVNMEVSSQIEAKDKKSLESYYSKGYAQPITETDIYEDIRNRFR